MYYRGTIGRLRKGAYNNEYREPLLSGPDLLGGNGKDYDNQNMARQYQQQCPYAFQGVEQLTYQRERISRTVSYFLATGIVVFVESFNHPEWVLPCTNLHLVFAFPDSF